MFVHLRTHTEFSVADGTLRVDEMVAAAARDGQGALAITDLSNLFGAIKFYGAARKAGVKPLIGCDVWLEGSGDAAAGGRAVDVRSGHVDASATRLLLLVQNRQGYLNLCELLARGFAYSAAQTTPGKPGRLQWPWLIELNAGLIVLSGADQGAVGQALLAGDPQRARDAARQLAETFAGRCYIELQRAGLPGQEAYVQEAVPLAAELGLPVVATHPVQFLTVDDFEAHEARVCIADGDMLANPRRVRRFTDQQYFKSQAQMKALFADVPTALQNTVEIARRCNLSLTLGKPMLPDFPTPVVDGARMPMDVFFRQESLRGLDERLALLYPDPAGREQQRPIYVKRLEFEIDTIVKMGFPGYFLIVADFINWAKNNGCPVGPGRGSGAGSLVAYALKITDLDPLKYGLIFERFLNPERVSMPDFDIDFCQANRDRVIDYVKQKYGANAVSQIATFGTMAARAAVRDVGRVLDLSYTFCDGISKLIPNKPGIAVTLQTPPKDKKKDDKYTYALEAEPLLAERERKEEDVRTLLELARKLEGITRNVGMHAGGVLIAPGKLTDFCPLYMQPGSDAAVSQYDKDDVEAIGLVKFDFLGLATLTILELAKDFITARHADQKDFSFDTVPLDDPKVFALFGRGETEAVFQFESRGMQGMLREAKPNRLEDLIAMNALYRPGPMELIPTYIARKHGREQPDYPDPRVEAILSETYGIMVYQEQVMQTAQILGGYSLGGADLLRRAMGKKKKEEMDAQRATFREGAARNGLTEQKADEVFDLMEKFAGYGFNKSHSAAYALLAYHTAWLKVHYPAEFFAANMTIELDDTDKLKVLFDDARRMGITFTSPDVNEGTYRFEPVSTNAVRYALGAVKGTGHGAVEAIVQARAEGGPFKSLFDFCNRVDRATVNKKAVEALIKAGAFDSLHGLDARPALLASLGKAFEHASTLEANANQGGLFDLGGPEEAADADPPLELAVPWSVRERLTVEKTAVGFYLSGHLFDEHAAEVRRFARRSLDELLDSREPQVLAGIVSNSRVVNVANGRMMIFTLDDKTRAIECIVRGQMADELRELIKDDALVVVQAKLQPDRFNGESLAVQQAWDLAGARCRFGKFLRVAVNGVGTLAGERFVTPFGEMLKAFPPRRLLTPQGELAQGLDIRVAYNTGAETCEIDFPGGAVRFFPTDDALQAWRSAAHEAQAEIVYD